MICAFQDQDYLYLVMDLLPGGNLRYHLTRNRRFNEEQAKFYIACTLLGLEYLHSEHIIHRDIKPENLVLDENGYAHITDFGIAKRFKHNNGKDTSGTMGYMAPEVLRRESHGYSVDYYALGIVTYEFMFGHRPYLAKTKKELKELILTSQAYVEFEDLPRGWSIDAADFINRLIQRKPKKRLGINSVNEVKLHSWFNDFEWKNLSLLKLIAPFIPKQGDNFDRKYCSAPDKIGNDTLERYKEHIMNSSYKDKFLKFSSETIPEEFKICFIKEKPNSNNNTTALNSEINCPPISGRGISKPNSRNFKTNPLQRHFNSSNCINNSLYNSNLPSQRESSKKNDIYAFHHRSNPGLERNGVQIMLKSGDNNSNVNVNNIKHKKNQSCVINQSQVIKNYSSFIVRKSSIDENYQNKYCKRKSSLKKEETLKQSNSYKLILPKPQVFERNKLPVINLSFSRKKSMIENQKDFFPYNYLHQNKQPKLQIRNKFLNNDVDNSNILGFNKRNNMNKSMYCKAPFISNKRLTINKSIHHFNI